MSVDEFVDFVLTKIRGKESLIFNASYNFNEEERNQIVTLLNDKGISVGFCPDKIILFNNMYFRYGI